MGDALLIICQIEATLRGSLRRNRKPFVRDTSMKKSTNTGLDVSRLRQDVEANEAAKEARGAKRDGRVKSGSMQAVRENLSQIKSLHADGHIWNTIAEALATQGMTQGDGDPITGRRLSALVSAIEKQAERRGHKLAARRQRRDIVQSAHASRLSSDLSATPRHQPSRSNAPSEDQLRRERLDAVKELFADHPELHSEG